MTEDQTPELTHKRKALSWRRGFKLGAAKTTVLLLQQVWGTAEGSVGRDPWTMPSPEDTGTTGRTQDTWELVTHTPGSLAVIKHRL